MSASTPPPTADGAKDADRVKPTPAASAPAPTPAKPAAPAEPQVIVFTEKEYSCQSGDSFETLSKHFYGGTDKYAAALKRHNQNHARASHQMANSGKITPGEKLFIPPADILEQRYPDTIAKPQSSTPGAVPASFNPPSGSSAPPATMKPVPSSAAPPLEPISSPTPAPSPPPPNR